MVRANFNMRRGSAVPVCFYFISFAGATVSVIFRRCAALRGGSACLRELALRFIVYATSSDKRLFRIT